MIVAVAYLHENDPMKKNSAQFSSVPPDKEKELIRRVTKTFYTKAGKGNE
jgi:hypothetical protein